MADALARSTRELTARRMITDRVRGDVYDTLASVGISPIALKGSALVESVFPEGVSRDMSDIDLLVDPGQLDAGTAALVTAGFVPLEDASHHSGDLRHDAKLIDPAGLLPVELHRHLLEEVDDRFDVGEVRARAMPSPHGSHRLPAPHDLLIHVALHFVASREVRSEGALSQVRDVAWIIRHGDVDWDAAQDVAARFGVADRLRLAVAVTARLRLVDARFDQEAPEIEDFLRARVLPGHALPPFGRWNEKRLQQAVWWSRVHLGDVAAGDLSDEREAQAAGVIGAGRAAARLTAVAVRDPRAYARERRLGRWLRTLH